MIINEDTGEVIGRLVRMPWQRVRVFADCYTGSRTHQSFRDNTDINNIVSRYERTGVLPSATRKPLFGDVTALQGDLTELYNKSRSTIDTAKKFEGEWNAKQESAKAAKRQPEGQAGEAVGGVGEVSQGSSPSPGAKGGKQTGGAGGVASA